MSLSEVRRVLIVRVAEADVFSASGLYYALKVALQGVDGTEHAMQTSSLIDSAQAAWNLCFSFDVSLDTVERVVLRVTTGATNTKEVAEARIPLKALPVGVLTSLSVPLSDDSERYESANEGCVGSLRVELGMFDVQSGEDTVPGATGSYASVEEEDEVDDAGDEPDVTRFSTALWDPSEVGADTEGDVLRRPGINTVKVAAWIGDCLLDGHTSRCMAFLVLIVREEGARAVLRTCPDFQNLHKMCCESQSFGLDLPRLKVSAVRMDTLCDELTAYLKSLGDCIESDSDNATRYNTFMEESQPISTLLAQDKALFGSGILTKVSAAMEGLLLRAVWDTAWAAEYVVLSPSSLDFFGGGKKPTLSIPLRDITSVAVMAIEDTPWLFENSCFEITTPSQTYVMWVPGGERYTDLWVSAVSAKSAVAGAPEADGVEVAAWTLGNINKWGRIGNGRVLLNGIRPCFSRESVGWEVSSRLLRTAMNLEPAEENFNVSLRRFASEASKLSVVNVAAMPEEEKLAFWLNTYHTLLIHALLVMGAPSGVLARKKFYDTPSYNVGGQPFALCEIEHGILRAPLHAPNIFGASYLPRKLAGREAFALTTKEERINFGLNVGSLSCPSTIEIYTPTTVRVQLANVMTAILVETVEVNPFKRTVLLPKIMEWYFSDFGKTKDEACQNILRTMDCTQSRQALKLYGDRARPPSLLFRPFDWDYHPSFVLNSNTNPFRE